MKRQITIPVIGKVLVYVDDELPIEEARKRVAEAVLNAELHGNSGPSKIHANLVKSRIHLNLLYQ